MELDGVLLLVLVILGDGCWKRLGSGECLKLL